MRATRRLGHMQLRDIRERMDDTTRKRAARVMSDARPANFSSVWADLRGQPFDMLRPETYEQWKDIEITFDPRDMVRG